METAAAKITKTYPARGPMQQFRLAEISSFRCFRCGNTKRSKLITTYNGNWSSRLCNGCYGRLIALFDIKAGTQPDDGRSEALADALLSAVNLEAQRQAERLYRAADERASRLTPLAVRFIATAEHVGAGLQSEPHLEWSPAVIGLCKAVELEIVSRILIPLAKRSDSAELRPDTRDKDLGRVAEFCSDQARPPPELGAFAHFLQTVIHSKRRRETSAIIQAFLQLARDWVGSSWILEPASLLRSLQTLTQKFRNRAAHIDELGKTDYLECRDLTIGEAGIMWRLLESTEPHR